ncbi:MAG: hypothetical protein H6656_02610 [Ardenticatenaceae bacterium]|nr:hypothetical protein [Ardenticatenaceae bacterium]
MVQPSVGAGPFSMVVDWQRPFPQSITPQTIVTQKTATALTIGPLEIEWQAKLWQPTPDWQLAS